MTLQEGGPLPSVVDESVPLDESRPPPTVVADDVVFNERFPTCEEFENLLE